MTEIDFGGHRIRVDVERTSLLNDSIRRFEDSDWCQCEGCTNERMTRARFMPQEQFQLLVEVGVDPQTPAFSHGRKNFPDDSRHKDRVDHCWLFYGAFDHTERAPKIEYEGRSLVWIDESDDSEDARKRIEFLPEVDREGILFMRTSNQYPRLYEQVDEFKTEAVSIPCPDCGFQWREVGKLIKESLIPSWYDLADLERNLQLPRNEVHVSICSRCGHLDYELTKK